MSFRSAQFWLTAFVATVVPLFFGTVDLYWISAWTVLLSVAGLCAIAISPSERQIGVLLILLLLSALYAGVAVVQTASNAFASLNDPVWQKYRSILDMDIAGRISARASIPPSSLGHFFLAALAFMNGIFVGTSRRYSGMLVRGMMYSILAYAVYGIAAEYLAPQALLWTSKTAYLGSVTGTFVNHNTAASYYGTGVILWFCYALVKFHEFRFSLREFLAFQSGEKALVTMTVRGLCTLGCMIALLQTHSRAGFLFGMVGLLVAAALIIYPKVRTRRWILIPLSLGVTLLVVGTTLQIGRIGNLGLFDEGRFQVYSAVLTAIGMRPWLGFGLGSFQDVFPAFRDSDLGAWGVWTYAHSTPLELAFEMGVPLGALICASAIAGTLFLVGGCSRQLEGSDRYTVPATASAVTFALLHSLIDFSLQVPGYAVVLAILAGCGMSRVAAGESDSRGERWRHLSSSRRRQRESEMPQSSGGQAVSNEPGSDGELHRLALLFASMMQQRQDRSTKKTFPLA